MNLATSIRKIVLGLNNKRAGLKPPVHLSIPRAVSKLSWSGDNLEKLIKRFLDHVLMVSYPESNVRILVHEKQNMSDLEKFFSTSPSYWLLLSVQSQAKTGFEKGAREILEDLGYRCSEWVGIENSDSQLGAFHHGQQDTLALVLFIQNHRTHRVCDFFIPVIESVPFFSHAI